MYKRFFAIITILVFMFTILPLQALAMSEVSVELPVKVDGRLSTIVIDAVDDAPLPAVTELRDVAEGKFVMSYSEPDTYKYKVYQKIESDMDGYYDETVYNVIVSTLLDDETEDGTLYTVVTIGIEGNSEKRDRLSFSNVESSDETTEPIESPSPSVTPGQNVNIVTGIDSNESLYKAVACLVVTGLICVGIYATRIRKRED